MVESTHGTGCSCPACCGGGGELGVVYEFTHQRQFDAFGNDFFIEPLADLPPESNPAQGSEIVWQDYDLSQTFSLHSKPNANHTAYLDFDGHVTSGTDWNQGFTGGSDIVTNPWSLDGDRNTFTNAELATIQNIWARVAEDFAPFDVNITTEEPPIDDLIRSPGADSRWGIRVVIGDNNWFQSAGGVAFVDSFNWDDDTPTFVFNTTEKHVAEAASHEIGHTMGLLHDGQAANQYYDGHGSGTTGWVPIMGVSYYRSLSQWSKGEYTDANNPQDDLAIIASQNGFGFRADDYGNTIATASPLINPGTSQIPATYGIIETPGDIDMLSFWAGAGPATIHVDPLGIGANLDVQAAIYNEAGTLIASSNPIGALNASLSLNLPAAGQYYLSIDGVGEGNPPASGYTDYGSLGNYRITGNVVAFSGGNLAPHAADDNSTTAAGDPVTIDVLANDTDPNGDILTVISVTQPAGGSAAIIGGSSVTYTPNTNFSGTDSFTYTISDGNGGQATGNVSVTVVVPTALTNGSFENGLVGWTVSGDVNTATSSIGESPFSGIYQAILTTDNTAGGDVPIVSLDSFLDLTAGTLNGVTTSSATAGSAMRQTVSVAAGTQITIRYNFLTREETPANQFNDFAFFSVASDHFEEAILLADTFTTGFGPSASLYDQSTGYRTLLYTFATAGTYTLGFGVSDSEDTSFDSAVLIDDLALSVPSSNNDPPVAVNDSSTSAEDSTVTIDVLANDSDPNSDPLTVVGVSQPGSGTASVNPNSTITYTPNANFNGNDSFTYTISDGNGGSAIAAVSIVVTPVNDSPNANSDSVVTSQDTPLTISVLINDSDIDGDPLTVISVTQPPNGNAAIVGNNAVQYTPATNFSGIDSFQYTISDGNGGTDAATVTVTVNPATTVEVMDDGPGFSRAGNWTYYTGEGYGGDLYFSASGSGADLSTWSFNSLAPGSYRVYATWTPHPNRGTNVPFSVNGSAPVLINQQLAPNDLVDAGASWEQIGDFSASGGSLSVTINDGANGYVIADAVRIERLQGVDLSVSVDGSDLVDGSSSVDFGAAVLGTPVSKVFTVSNTGADPVTLTGPVSVPNGFSASGFGQSTLNAGESTTFTVTLTAATLGAYSGEVSFESNDPDESPFNFNVSGAVVNSAPHLAVIDNGETGFAKNGTWTYFVGQGRDNDVDFSAAGSGADLASWTFNVPTAGLYRVAATWSPHPNRATDAPYTILGGATPITIDVNQQLSPNDFADGGSNWEELTTVNVQGTTLTVRLTDAANGYVIADAIRIETADGSEISVTADDNAIADGSGSLDFGTVVVGSPTLKTITVSNIGNETLNLMEPISVPNGFSASSFGQTALAPNTSTTFTVTLDATSVGNYSGQLSFMNDDADESPYNFTISGSVIAPPPSIQIIDDGATGFSAVGNWTHYTYTPEGYNADVYFSAAGSGNDAATWTFAVPEPGTYRVSSTWTTHSNRATNAPYTITGGASPVTVLVNQQLTPNDFSESGFSWEDLANVTTTGTTLTIQLTDAANGYVIADAVRVELISSSSSSGGRGGGGSMLGSGERVADFRGRGRNQADDTHDPPETRTPIDAPSSTYRDAIASLGTRRVDRGWSGNDFRPANHERWENLLDHLARDVFHRSFRTP